MKIQWKICKTMSYNEMIQKSIQCYVQFIFIQMSAVFFYILFFMIYCKFCEGIQGKYLYLVCKHLCCLSCAFLRSNFSAREIECCHRTTIIDNNAMETIMKNTMNSNSVMKYMNKTSNQNQQTQKKEEKLCQSYQQNSCTGSRHDMKQKSQPVDRFYQQIPQQLPKILKLHKDRINKKYQQQRQELNRRQDYFTRRLIDTFNKELKIIGKSSSPAKQQNLNLLLQKQINKLITNKPNNKNVELKQLNNSRETNKESYDHILKRLHTNQQRMKQSIRRHLLFLY